MIDVADDMPEELCDAFGDMPPDVPKLKRAGKYIPVKETPKEELRHLIRQHRTLVKLKVSGINQCSEKKLKDGTVIPCPFPEDDAAEIRRAVSLVWDKRIARTENYIEQTVKRMPVYNEFFSKVSGIGPVTAAYCLHYVDLAKAVKPSNVRMRCGIAVRDGRMVKPRSGELLPYVAEMRTRLYVAFNTMYRTLVGRGKSNKYIDRWLDYKAGAVHQERFRGIKTFICPHTKTKRSVANFVHKTGRLKATDLFLEDFYTIGRTVEGMPVWPDYHAARLGYSHGGKVCVNEPRMLSLGEAWDAVGSVESHELVRPAEILEAAE